MYRSLGKLFGYPLPAYSDSFSSAHPAVRLEFEWGWNRLEWCGEVGLRTNEHNCSVLSLDRSIASLPVYVEEKQYIAERLSAFVAGPMQKLPDPDFGYRSPDPYNHLLENKPQRHTGLQIDIIVY